jgi:hypothetical protein
MERSFRGQGIAPPVQQSARATLPVSFVQAGAGNAGFGLGWGLT